MARLSAIWLVAYLEAAVVLGLGGDGMAVTAVHDIYLHALLSDVLTLRLSADNHLFARGIDGLGHLGFHGDRCHGSDVEHIGCVVGIKKLLHALSIVYHGIELMLAHGGREGDFTHHRGTLACGKVILQIGYIGRSCGTVEIETYLGLLREHITSLIGNAEAQCGLSASLNLTFLTADGHDAGIRQGLVADGKPYAALGKSLAFGYEGCGEVIASGIVALRLHGEGG